jgi:ribose transport system permease protein
MAQAAFTWHLASVAAVLVGVVSVLAIAYPGFRTSYNLESLGQTLAIVIVVGLAQAVVLSIGQFNLAIGSLGAIAAIFVGYLMEVAHVPPVVAVPLAIGSGLAGGALQGALIALTGINPFIVTVALSSIFAGAMLGLTGSSSFSHLPAPFLEIGQGHVLGIPTLLAIALVIAGVMTLFMTVTVLARQMLATGASQRAAQMSGVPISRIVIGAQALSGGLAATAGVLLVAELGSAQPYTGADWLLRSFAAPVIGGTLLSGGRVSVVGTVLGATLLAVIENGLVLSAVDFYWYQAFLGVIILGAILLERGRLAVTRRQRWSA